MKQHLKDWLLLLALLLPFAMIAQTKRQSQLFNSDWKFYKGDVENGEKTGLDVSKWMPVELPHDWAVKEPMSPSNASAAGYLPGGIGWYRKSFFVDADKKGKETSIYFEGVTNNSEVFIDGHSLGKRPNGFVSFFYDLTPHLKYGDTNVIAVRVDHSKYNDARWYTGSGICRNVYLNTVNPLHLQQWGTNYYTSSTDKKGAVVLVGSVVQNTSSADAKVTVLQEVFDKKTNQLLARGKQSATIKAGNNLELNVRLNVNGAQAWSVESPNLYTLKTSLLQDKNLVDNETANIGFRTLRFDANSGFALNGTSMKLKGVCIHHDAGVLGAAVPRQVWERRLKTLKTLGCNAIRMSHNPQDPDVYDLCDELGLLVMDEAFDEWKYPKKKWIEGWNVGTPGFDGYAPNFEQWGEKDLADMILRDRRHPSVIMWSIGNEVDYPNDPYSHPVMDSAKIGQQVFGRYLPDNPNAMELGVISRKLVQVVKANDTTRPSTAALAGVVMSNYTGYPDAVDIAGYNYTENRYEIDHKTYPRRILYGSENRHDMASWKAVRDSKNIFGQFLWTGIDYLGESGRWPARGSQSGLLNLSGFVKPNGYFRRALWADTPVVYIGTFQAKPNRRNMANYAPSVWNYNEGDTIRVVCYTNCPQAKLRLNGNDIGAVKNYDDATGIIFWDIPYAPGKLEVVALKDNQPVAKDAIQTSGRPYKLIATIDKNLRDTLNDLAQVIVSVVDENNIPVVLADNNITCTVEGPAKLLGLESSDNSDTGNYTDNVQRVYQGKLLAYIQSSKPNGTVNVTFSSPLLQSATIILRH